MIELQWTTFRIAKAANGWLLDVDGRLLVATTAALARELAAALGVEPDAIPDEDDPKKHRTTTKQRHDGLLARLAETPDQFFTARDLADWFPSACNYKQALAFVAAATVDGRIVAGDRTPAGVSYRLAGSAPPPAPPPPSDDDDDQFVSGTTPEPTGDLPF